MDQRQQLGQQPTGNSAQPPITPNPHGMTQMNNGQQGMGAQGQGVASQLMDFMTMMSNPTLATAAAGSQVFPNPSMLSNPSAFFTMPNQNGNYNVATMQQMATRLPANNGNGNHHGQHSIQMNIQGIPMLQNGSTPNAQHGIVPVSVGSGVVIPQMTTSSNVVGNGYPGMQQPGQHSIQINHMHVQPSIISYNGMPQNAPASMQMHIAAAAPVPAFVQGDTNGQDGKGTKRKKDLSANDKARQNRDRNREHAKTTRLRKKAYVQKLTELVEGLHAERTEELRQRRVAIQHLSETQNVRRAVIRSFLQFNSKYERDKRKWSAILEDDVWVKQPVTPYRCYRRGELEQDCRMSRGIDAVIADAASVAVMMEGVGSRSTRWMHMKREAFFMKEEERTGTKRMPRDILRQTSRFQLAISNLSSSSGSSNNDSNSSSGEGKSKASSKQRGGQATEGSVAANNAGAENSNQNVSNSSASNNDDRANQHPSAGFHDYHAQPLPDPKLSDPERSSTAASDDSPEESNTSADEMKRGSTDSSSGDDCVAAVKNPRPLKRRKHESEEQAFSSSSFDAAKSYAASLPPNIAKKGGIFHNVRSVLYDSAASVNGNDRLSIAPAVPVPPFAGVGEKAQPSPIPSTEMSQDVSQVPQAQIAVSGQNDRNRDGNAPLEGPAVISADIETSSSNSSGSWPRIRAYYHVNEDDMVITDDILMCPFLFRTQDAVLCGALAECVMPGMLRGTFSSTNKLVSMEMVYDAMGFLQQLELASGSEDTAHMIPGSLEMALSPTANEARVITLAEPPFLIVNVNEAWTRMTKYTQTEVEGLDLFGLLQGGKEEKAQSETNGNPAHHLDDIVQGRCTCSTRLHYDREGREFVDFISSYPLTNASDEISHVLHIIKELQPPPGSEMEEKVA